MSAFSDLFLSLAPHHHRPILRFALAGGREETFLESCGVADLVASCYGGRNRRGAAAFAEGGGEKSMETLAEEMLKGQKLQGKLTADEVHAVLQRNQWEADFPLFTTIHKIVNGELPVTDITSYF